MFIDLKELEDFNYSMNSSAYAYVKDGMLYFKGNVSFEKVMIALAYHKYGNKCWYCGQKFSKKAKRTIDHKYPVIYGGITILDNLVPCCSYCNEEKSNLTEQQYKEWKVLKSAEQEEFRYTCIGKNEKRRILEGTILPKKWFERKASTILAPIDFEAIICGKKHDNAKRFYWKNRKLENPVIISRNGIVLDGFMSLWIAKELGVKKIPTIRLENVIVEN